MKTITKLLLAISLALCISCDNDATGQEQLTTEVKSIKEIPSNFIGEYKHHLGEKVTGTISITKTTIVIKTSTINYTIDINSPNIIIKIWCNDHNLMITFIQNSKEINLIISNYLNRTENTNYIVLSRDYNTVGIFDPIKPVEVINQ